MTVIDGIPYYISSPSSPNSERLENTTCKCSCSPLITVSGRNRPLI